MEIIKPTQYLGIWMDYSVAYLMEYTRDSMETEIMESNINHENRDETLNRSESLLYNKEQLKQRRFYDELGDIIKKYDEVILFGPTDAKVELLNILEKNHHFDKINISIEEADKMSENQRHAFVKSFFLKIYSDEKAS
ncbi:hypothetical protein [Arcicella rosea]|uniref:Uncharacterized protein n=1 Tax=Arcicella rosea TaxID=502909 RepID=A0A841EHY7_9BACT|nr:hypothetical protein [Arcicella rosea]MBB6002596.1 hypothetical protein [Arcicella rosea]